MNWILLEYLSLGRICLRWVQRRPLPAFAVFQGPWPSPVAQRLKRLPGMRETWVRSLGREDPREKEMATHSSTLAWRIPWREKPGRLLAHGVAKSQTWLNDFTFTFKAQNNQHIKAAYVEAACSELLSYFGMFCHLSQCFYVRKGTCNLNSFLPIFRIHRMDCEVGKLRADWLNIWEVLPQIRQTEPAV